MILTQKMTSLAFSVHDGMYKEEKQLKYDQKKYCVKYVNYIFLFVQEYVNSFWKNTRDQYFVFCIFFFVFLMCIFAVSEKCLVHWYSLAS